MTKSTAGTGHILYDQTSGCEGWFVREEFHGDTRDCDHQLDCTDPDDEDAAIAEAREAYPDRALLIHTAYDASAEPRDVAQVYDGWKIQTGFLEGNLFGADVDGIDQAASADNYARMLEKAVEDAFPGAFVTIRREGASGCEPANMHYAHSPARDHDAEQEVEAEVEAEVGSIGESIYEDFHWIEFLPGTAASA